MEDFDILSIGDASMDVFVYPSESEEYCRLDTKKAYISFVYGDKIPIRTLEFSIGGNAANNAVGVKRLGLNPCLILTIGDDDIGKKIEDSLIKEGLDTTYIVRQAGARSNYSTVINYAGERTILVYHAPRSYEFPVKMPRAKWVYLTSMGENFLPFYNHLYEWLNRNKDVKLAFNPGSYQLRVNPKVLEKILGRTDLLYVNREEAERISSFKGSKGREKELLKRVLALGPKIVVVTDGVWGSYFSDGKEFLKLGILPVDAYERTGAGDAYGAGFISALIKGKSYREAMLWGTVNSASVIGYIGAQKGLLRETEIKLWLERAKSVNLKPESF